VIRSLNIWLAAWALLAAALLGQGSAQAQDKKRVAILEFTGPSAGAFQAQVSGGLKERSNIELVSSREVKSTADRLDNSLSSPTEVKEVGEALQLSAIIDGNVVKSGRNLQCTVRVRDASTGEVVHEETWSKARRQVKTIKPTVWAALGSSIKGTSVPVKAKPAKATKPTKPTKPTPAPVAEDDLGDEESEAEDEEEEPKPRRRPVARQEEPDDEEEDKPKRKKAPGNLSVDHPALVAAFGPRIMWRSLSYDGDTNLNSYTSSDQGSPSFNLALSAQYFPGAHSSTEWYADLGLDLDVDYALGLKSKQNGKELSTTAYELGLGVVYRHRFGAFVPRIRAGYVKHVFDVDVPADVLLPSISYSAVRLGLGTSVDIVDWVIMDASFAYLPVFGTGELSEARYGDKVDTGAWEAGAGLLMRFKEVYGARLAIDYRRYKYDFGLSDNAEIALPKAGTDSYLRTTLSFVYTLPGAR
jgi:TolB-like protein